MKIYSKLGKPSHKEAKMIKAIQSSVEKKLAENPNMKFTPASNPEELEKLYREHSSTEVEFEEVKPEENNPTDIEQNHKEFREGLEKTVVPKPETMANDGDFAFVDPFNDADPIVRDYVTDNNFDKNPPSNDSSNNKTSFEEPTTFKDAFVMPDSNAKSSNPNDKKEKKEEPLNPSYNNQSGGRKKRSNKKFAKYIVEAVCMLAERGFVWWTTKDITEAKIAEYELNDEMDLTLLLTMPNGQQATVKEWFGNQRINAEQLAKFEQAEKDDLAEILAEVLDKKGITPSEEQELLIIAFSMFGKKFMVAWDMKKGINNIIEQLKDIKKNGVSNQQQQYQQEPVEQGEQIFEQPQQEVQYVQEDEQHSVIEDIEGNFGAITDLVTT